MMTRMSGTMKHLELDPSALNAITAAPLIPASPLQILTAQPLTRTSQALSPAISATKTTKITSRHHVHLHLDLSITAKEATPLSTSLRRTMPLPQRLAELHTCKFHTHTIYHAASTQIHLSGYRTDSKEFLPRRPWLGRPVDTTQVATRTSRIME